MTTYEKGLLKIVEDNYSALSHKELTMKLIEMGVVDFHRLKILTVREYVAQLMRSGQKKVNAMWLASEQFACTYEYIRKCMYYYTDVNI